MPVPAWQGHEHGGNPFVKWPRSWSAITFQSRDFFEAAHQQDADGLQTIGCQQVQLL